MIRYVYVTGLFVGLFCFGFFFVVVLYRHIVRNPVETLRCSYLFYLVKLFYFLLYRVAILVLFETKQRSKAAYYERYFSRAQCLSLFPVQLLDSLITLGGSWGPQLSN